MDDLRWTITRNTLVAADHFGAFGVGAGGFVAAYQSTEPDADRQSVLINRAHNDGPGMAPRGGWPLIAAIALGLVCWPGAASPRRHRGDPAVWQRAAAIGLWLVLLHSLGDYPLRTTAIAGVGAVLAASLCARERHASRAADEYAPGWST